MKRILIGIAILFSGYICAAEPFLALDKLIQADVPNAYVGLWIQDADTQAVLYSQNGNQGFVPASLVKSFTTAASLLDLDRNFTYQTMVRYNPNQLQDHSLNGNLSIVFTGDPSLSTAEFTALLQTLSRNQIKTISGDIILDDSYFSKPDYGRGWLNDDLNWYFATPAKSIIIDENQFSVILTPSDTLGKKVNIRLADSHLLIPISADINTVTEEEANTLCQLNIERNDQNNGIHFYGCWPLAKDQKETTLKIALPNSALLAQQIIKQSLAEQNITFTGNIVMGAAQGSDVLAVHHSPTLEDLHQIIMRQSNNIYADSLLKVLGKKNYDRGTTQAGSFAMMNILKNKLGINIKDTRLFDGSGGSMYNQVTPQNVAQLLQAMYNKAQYQYAFLTSMQVKDEKHFFYNRLPENITTPLYIKTGSMTGVSNIAGYVKTHSGRTLIVVSLLNHLPLDRAGARKFEKELIGKLIQI